MRTADEMLKIIMQTAEQLKVQAVTLNGSRVYQASDQLQDFDVVYVVADAEMPQLIEERSWLQNFGEIVIMQTPMDLNPKPIDYTKRFNFLLLLQDGNRVDLGLVPRSQVELWAKKDPVAKVLADPEGILADLALTTSPNRYRRKQPSQGAFTRHCNEFWWTTTYVAKGLKRQQFMYAADNYYENVLGEYLVILEWSVSGRNDFTTIFGQNLKYLFDYLTPAEAEKIQAYCDFSTSVKIKNKLLALMTDFDQMAADFAVKYGYQYNQREALQTQKYVQDLLNGES